MGQIYKRASYFNFTSESGSTFLAKYVAHWVKSNQMADMQVFISYKYTIIIIIIINFTFGVLLWLIIMIRIQRL